MMNGAIESSHDRTRVNPVHFHDLHPTPADMRAEVLAGLALPQKRIAPKFFYDARARACSTPSVSCPSTTRPAPRSASCAARRRDGRAARSRRAAGGTRQRQQPEDPDPAGGPAAGGLHAGGHLQGASAAVRASPGRHAFPGCRCMRSAPTTRCPSCCRWMTMSTRGRPSSRARRWATSSRTMPSGSCRRVGDMLGAGGRLLIGVDLVKDSRASWRPPTTTPTASPRRST
jgi:hypothetical protein